MKRHLLAALLAATALLMGCDTSEVLDEPIAKKTASSTTASGSIGVASPTPTPGISDQVAVDFHLSFTTTIGSDETDHYSISVENKSNSTVDVTLILEVHDAIGGPEVITDTKVYRLGPKELKADLYIVKPVQGIMHNWRLKDKSVKVVQ